MRWLVFFLLFPWLAFAQPVGMPPRAAAVASPCLSYVGPGDIVSGATFWGGIRAYNSAYACAGGKLVKIKRQSDSATADVLAAANGGLGVTANATAGSNGISPFTWGGTDATGTGSITGTTLTFTGGTIGDQVSGTGVAAGTFIVSGTSPTWTVNISQAVASEALTLAVGLVIQTLYDQSGHGRNATNAGTQRYLLASVLNGGARPVLGQPASITGDLTASLPSSAQPVSFSAVAERVGDFTSLAEVFRTQSPIILLQFDNAVNHSSAYAGTGISYVAADSTPHAFQVVFNGVSGAINIDGADTTAQNYGTAGLGPFLDIGDSGGDQFINGFIGEIGIWSSTTFSSGNRSSLHSNQSAFWGTP